MSAWVQGQGTKQDSDGFKTASYVYIRRASGAINPKKKMWDLLMPIDFNTFIMALDLRGMLLEPKSLMFALALMALLTLGYNLLCALRYRSKLAEYRNIHKLEHHQLERLNEIVAEERNCIEQELTKARMLAEVVQVRHQEKLVAIRKEYMKIFNALRSCQQEKKVLKSQNEQYEKDLVRLRDEFEEARLGVSASGGVTGGQKELEERIRQLKGQLLSGNDELDKERCVAFELRRKISDLEKANAELKQENTLLVASVARPAGRFASKVTASDMGTIMTS